MPSFSDVLRLYDYAFPPQCIAQSPATPRDSAKLLAYERASGTVHWKHVRDLPALLPHNAILVLNETKVIPARLHLTRVTSGRVDVLFLRRERNVMHVLANRKLRQGEILTLDARHAFTVLPSKGKEWRLRPNFPIRSLPKIFLKHGSMPLPPYIKHSPLTEKELRKRYQTIFAKKEGSIAAPTASLHFTTALLKALERKGITIARVTLHVHLGTFSPLTEEQWKTGKLHPEAYSIDSRTVRLLMRAKRLCRPIVAAGTTVARTLESAADSRGNLVHPSGVTRLFIRPSTPLRAGYRFRFIDGLLTNFHVPKSSLLMLVSALVGREKLLDLYQQAIDRKFRLFSFGDAMLIV